MANILREPSEARVAVGLGDLSRPRLRSGGPAAMAERGGVVGIQVRGNCDAAQIVLNDLAWIGMAMANVAATPKAQGTALVVKRLETPGAGACA